MDTKMPATTTTTTTTPAQFRVIVVGAGVAGLTASHCLQKAGIDHVVLERRDNVAPPEGASISVYPHGCRILHQIGCLKELQEACAPNRQWWMNRPDGTTFMDFDYYDTFRENHAYDLYTLERRKFLQILYDGLPDKSYIRTGCNVKSITQHAGGVDVALEDGSVETGDMVLGVDGVSSRTRTLMWEHADKISPGLITRKDKTCMKTTYNGLIGVSPAIPNLGADALVTIYDEGLTFLILPQPEQVFWIVCIRRPEIMEWPQRARWSEKDAEEQAAKLADHPLTKDCKFGDLWNTRSRGVLVPMEEGLLDRWYHDRIVLAGDSAHKVTPNIALGGNSAMESVVVLCNHLHKMVAEQEGAKPSLATLNKIFAAYQEERHGRMKAIVDLSSMMTRMEAWDNVLYKFISTWVMPMIPHWFIVKQLGNVVEVSAKLDYVPLVGFSRGKTPYKYDHDVEPRDRPAVKS